MVRICSILLVFGFYCGVSAQDRSEEDAINPLEYEKGIGGTEVGIADTSLDNFHYYKPTEEQHFLYRNTGALGGAHFHLFKPATPNFGVDLGFNQFDLYQFHHDSLRYYHPGRLPHTHLFILIGLKKEQVFGVAHSQRIKKRFFFGFHFKRYGISGDYTGQETKHNGIVLTSDYSTKNNRYFNRTYLGFNNAVAQENGGIQDVTVFENNGSPQAALTDVELTSAENEYRNIHFQMRHGYRWGHKWKEQVNDTTEVSHLIPTLSIYHEFGVGRTKYIFSDAAPDSSYYGFFYDFDTLLNLQAFTDWHIQYENKIGISRVFATRVGDTNTVYKNIQFDVGARHQYHILKGEWNHRFQYLDVSGSVSSNALSGSPFNYNAAVSYALLGDYLNDFSVKGSVGYAFGKPGAIGISGSLQRTEPSWIFKEYDKGMADWDDPFGKVTTLSSTIFYRLDSINMHFRVGYFLSKNLTYWNENYLPRQHSGLADAWFFELRKLFLFKGLGFDNLIRAQVSNHRDVIRFPTFWSKHTLYYELKLFKKALLTRFGIDLYYNTNYKGYGYFPLTGQFYVQNDQTMRFYPVLDFFLIMKVKTVRIFLKLHHLNQGMFKDNGYFNAYKYPARNFTFRVGISWRFAD